MKNLKNKKTIIAKTSIMVIISIVSINLFALDWKKEWRDQYHASDNCLTNRYLKLKTKYKDFYTCKDHTISFSQPRSDMRGYEGRCAHTAAANVLAQICRKIISPKSLISYNWDFSDITPGVRPKHLSMALNNIFKKYLIPNIKYPKNFCPNKNWNSFQAIGVIGNANNRINLQSYIDSLRERVNFPLNHIGLIKRRVLNKNLEFEWQEKKPIIALIGLPGNKTIYHYVMVVDVVSRNNRCKVVTNTWSTQWEIPCLDFAKMAAKHIPHILSPFTIISL